MARPKRRLYMLAVEPKRSVLPQSPTRASEPSRHGAGGGVGARDHLVSSIVVRAVVDALEAHGGASEALAQLAGSDSGFLSDPRSALPREEFLLALEQALRTSGNASLGLSLGTALTESSFHMVGPLIMTSVSARQAIDSFLELRRTLLGGTVWTLQPLVPQQTAQSTHERAGHDFVLGHPLDFAPGQPLGVGARVEAEIGVTLAFHFAPRFWSGLGMPGSLRAVFAYPRPAHVARYHEVFGQQVSFDGPLNGLAFPNGLLDVQRPGASPELADAFRSFALERFLSPTEDTTWTERVQRTLKSARNLAELDFDALVQDWGISLRSLRRKLEAEQTSLSTLIERARFERAREQLVRRTVSVREIAESLGYFEVSSFQRAFKRWAGVTPGTYRRQAREARDAGRSD